MARSRRRVSRGTTNRRKLVWARALQPFSALNAQVAQAPIRVDLLSSFEAALSSSLIGCTIMRMRGALWVQQGSAGGVASNIVFAARVGDFTELTGGSTADQNPCTAASDWFMYEPMAHRTAASYGDDLSGRLVDVRSHRKLDELGQSLLLFAGGDAAAASTVNFGFALSILVALP